MNRKCSECGKNFVFYTSIWFYHKPEKADCLNGGEHKWRIRLRKTPLGVMRCEVCGEVRRLTTEEKVEFDIPSREEYRKQGSQYAA